MTQGIGEFLTVRPQPTVVQLEHLKGSDSEWITNNYFVTEDVRAHLNIIEHRVKEGLGAGFFVIGHYGSGKSHFLAFLTKKIESKEFGTKTPTVCPISLINFKSQWSLEEVIQKELQLETPSHDRRVNWSKLKEKYPSGLFLVLDELSEFLRSKSSPQLFNEDIRFLQFLGERAQNEPLWILAALQESIEHIGEIERDLFRKIKDRYPYRMLLTPTHVRDLIGKQLLVRKPGFDLAVEKLFSQFQKSFPKNPLNFEDFRSLYPLHPATLELLEEVRDCFSQSRGIVEFTLTRILGDSARAIPSFLSQPWGKLISPDIIITHFMDLLEVQPEFVVFSQKILPFYRKHISELFENPAQQELAWKLIHLLMLVHLSPQRRTLSLQQATWWLLPKISILNPEKNHEVIEKTLNKMSQEGAFIDKKGNTFAINDSADDRKNFDRLLTQVKDELRVRGDGVFDLLIPLLDRADFNPFLLKSHQWQTKMIRWHFHDWSLEVGLSTHTQQGKKEGISLLIGLPWEEARDSKFAYQVQPRRITLTEELIELAALGILSERPLPAPMKERIENLLKTRKDFFAKPIAMAYREVELCSPTGYRDRFLLPETIKTLPQWLGFIGERLLGRHFPQFEKFAPVLGPLAKEAYRQFIKTALEDDFLSEEAPAYVKQIREGYLVPLGLLRRQGSSYRVITDLDHHELIAHIHRLLPHQPNPKAIYNFFSEPLYGLVLDQVHLLLIFLYVQGEIDIVKGGVSLRDSFQALSLPIQYDKLLIGKGLSFTEQAMLKEICLALKIDFPLQVSVYHQRQIAQKLKRKAERSKVEMEKFLLQLGEIESSPLYEKVQNLITYWNCLEKGDGEIQNLEQFLYEIPSPGQFITLVNELSNLPEFYERLSKKVAHCSFLLNHPALNHCVNPQLREEKELLGVTPDFSEPAHLKAWIDSFEKFYKNYQSNYRSQHDQWWQEIRLNPLWNYTPPSVALSEHLTLAQTVAQVDILKIQGKNDFCPGLSGLDFQPICRCGFGTGAHPILSVLEELKSYKEKIEKELTLFFRQESVLQKIKDWGAEKKVGDLQIPQIENVKAFDQLLSGVSLVEEFPIYSLEEALGSQPLSKSDFVERIKRFVDKIHKPQIQIQRASQKNDRKNDQKNDRSLLLWSLKHALQQGIPLPESLGFDDYRIMTDNLEKQWIGARTLENLENLHLGDSVLFKIVAWILQGDLAVSPGEFNSELVKTALSFRATEVKNGVKNIDEYEKLVFNCYTFHNLFLKLKNKEWLGFLDKMANSPVAMSVPSLLDLLKKEGDTQWVLMDALGLPLISLFRQQNFFAPWRMTALDVVCVSAPTTTDDFYTQLVAGKSNKSFEKINILDQMVHQEKVFSDFLKRARVELEIAGKKMAKKLDPQKKLLIFGDHGFRIDESGSGFCHGGSSSLEKMTLAIHLEPVNDSQ